MHFLQVRFTGSKEDLKFATLKIAKMVEKMPDDAGDLQDRWVVTITQRCNKSHTLSKVVRYEPHDQRRRSLQERQGLRDGSIPAENSSGETRETPEKGISDEETDTIRETGDRKIPA